MTRRFNVAGPCRPDWHYMIPAASRLPEARRFIEDNAYFVVHAPRQTGKTTTLMSLAAELTASGRYAAIHFSCEVGEVAGDDDAKAQRIISFELRRAAARMLPADLQPPEVPRENEENLLAATLTAWANACPRPLVLIFDEIDALRGHSLVSVLRQLRSGYPGRPKDFPASVILCGLRDVRDYKAASGGDPRRMGTSSPFNIKVSSLRLGDFTESDMRALYAQHTAETGQPFTEEALLRAWDVTRGQPWLVNALGRKIVQEIAVPLAEPITAAHVDDAKERLILERATHLDSLVDKLMEPRVRRVMEPLVAGLELAADPTYHDDVSYLRDLGLITPKHPLQIANPIYKEVIVRVLGGRIEDRVEEQPSAFRLPDGRFAWRRALRAFSRFWREPGEILSTRMPYPEAGPQLVVMSYLQSLVNGGGYLDREYGIGRGRIDLLMRYPYRKPDGSRAVQRRAMEVKVWRTGQSNPLKKGLVQLDDYLARLGLSRGTLLIFDARSPGKGPGQRPRSRRVRLEDTTTRSGRAVRVMWA